jgi:hypothetical protein
VKVIVIAHRKEDASPEDFAPHADSEANHALGMYRDEIIREVYSRADGKGAIMVLECDDEEHAGRLVAELPLARAGLLSFDIYGARPYRGIVQHIK